jgi:predicted N-formylglutamate amidohydrolase
MNQKTLIISCEHAVNVIPTICEPLFDQKKAILATHEAFDFGAIDIAKHFSRAFDCPLIEATVSRLVIDCNRRLNHPNCFSSFSKKLSKAEKELLIQTYYTPFRQLLESKIQNIISNGNQVIHLSIHSFTPVLNNIPRNADIGLLYDPSRLEEKHMAAKWRTRILKENIQYRIRMNYPYRGSTDGTTSWLRKRYPENDYLGFEVECNQALTRNDESLKILSEILVSSFAS